MSKVLMIRHLPTGLSFQEKEELLKHFGAESVWETSSKRNYVFAAFKNAEKAKSSLIRLHQLEIAKRRLVVEYSFGNEPVIHNKKDDEQSSVTNQVKEYLRTLNAWNPSVDFYQPPPTHLSYKYPDITPKTVINIVQTLFTHKPFYTQTLHLMNKMSLDTPFNDNLTAYTFFKEHFREFFLDELQINLPTTTMDASETESEISSDENEHRQKHQKKPPTVKKTDKLLSRKRLAAALQSATVSTQSKQKKLNTEEVFETVTPEVKKIEVVVHADALKKPAMDHKVVGELGKFDKPVESVEEEIAPSEPELPIVSKNELLKNKISYNDMKMLPVFKNYHAGEPCMRLYIKNLAKTVTEQDLKRIYKRYVQHLSEDKQEAFDLRLMQEGRMKGQAFVTFPSISLAEIALNETNGYMLREKPMVVQFARVPTKKSID